MRQAVRIIAHAWQRGRSGKASATQDEEWLDFG